MFYITSSFKIGCVQNCLYLKADITIVIQF